MYLMAITEAIVISLGKVITSEGVTAISLGVITTLEEVTVISQDRT